LIIHAIVFWESVQSFAFYLSDESLRILGCAWQLKVTSSLSSEKSPIIHDMELCANLGEISDELLYFLDPFLPVICATDTCLGEPQFDPLIRRNGPAIIQPFSDNIVTRPFMWRNITRP
jgi:hypothetical protein